MEHVGEESDIVRVVKVNDLLAAADEFELDSMLLIAPGQEGTGDLELWELPVEYPSTLDE